MPLAQKMLRYVKPEPQQITIWRRISYLMPQLKSFRNTILHAKIIKIKLKPNQINAKE